MLITAVAAAIFLLVYLYLPAHRQMLALAQEHEHLDQEVMKLEQELDETRKTAERIKALKRTPSTQSVSQPISSRESLAQILEELNQLAKATAVDFFSVRPEKIEDTGTLQAQPVLIDLKSTFKGMGMYLQMLENSPRMIKIQNLQMEADPGDASYILTHLHLTVYMEKH